MISSPKIFIWLCPVLKNDREKMSQLKKRPISINPCVLQGPVTWTKFLSKKKSSPDWEALKWVTAFSTQWRDPYICIFFLFHAKAKKKLIPKKSAKSVVLYGTKTIGC